MKVDFINLKKNNTSKNSSQLTLATKSVRHPVNFGLNLKVSRGYAYNQIELKGGEGTVSKLVKLAARIPGNQNVVIKKGFWGLVNPGELMSELTVKRPWKLFGSKKVIMLFRDQKGYIEELMSAIKQVGQEPYIKKRISNL